MQAHTFTKMIHFTRLIKAGGRLREFNLRKLNRPDAEVFSVDTVDDRGNRIIFRIQKQDNGSWVIVPQDQPLFSWIHEIEPLLQQQIEEEMHGN
jgi:hypothetical protein